MDKRNKIEDFMEILSIIASILMGLTAIYGSYKAIKRDVKQLVNRGDNGGS